MRDDDVRSACFAALDVLQAKWGADVPYPALAEGFNFRGRRVPFLNRAYGIYRAKDVQRGPAAQRDDYRDAEEALLAAGSRVPRDPVRSIHRRRRLALTHRHR